MGLVLLSVAARAQYYSSTNAKAVKQYEKGVNLYAVDPANAITCFEQALKLDPKFSEVYLTLGDIYMEQGKWAEARQKFDQFLKTGSRHKAWVEEAQHNIDCIDFRLYALANPVPFNPQNLGANINTAYDEYLPTLTADGNTLIITRRMPRNERTTADTPEEEDFYISTYEYGAWTKATRMSEPVNSTDNEGAQCISQDGRIMIFTACNRPDGFGRCDLYMCVRHGNKWGAPRNIGVEINSRSWESQPCLSMDGRTLYFVSDRKGGYGGKDIWYSQLTEDGWSTPKNMGASINTSGDESSPFIHFDDTTFYFASTGHVGMGGSDLFLSRRQSDGTWGKPQNLGYPINTDKDESNLIVSADGLKAYFSSDNLNGYGRQDLYCFDLPPQLRPIPIVYKEEIAEANELEVGEAIILKNVLFATGKATLSESSKVELDKVAELLTQCPTMKIELGGHTDNVGKAEDNQLLSERRAQACYQYILEKGIDEGRLSYKGYGETQPISENDTEEGRAQNRRTVFTILSK